MQHMHINLLFPLLLLAINNPLYAADPAGEKPDTDQTLPASSFKENFRGFRSVANNYIEWGQNNIEWTRENVTIPNASYCVQRAPAVLFFTTTLWLNKYFGQGKHSFNPMLSLSDEPKVVINENGTITHMSDGKQWALLLSNIPEDESYFTKIRSFLEVPINTPLDLHTMNESFEITWVALAKTIKTDGCVNHHWYPTIDCTAPLHIDLIRGVNTIANRTNHTAVHCKAGKGRSGAMTIATLIHVFMLAKTTNKIVNPDGTPYTQELPTGKALIPKIIEYGKEQRNVLKINAKQMPGLEQFLHEYTDAGSLEKLYKRYAYAILERETAVGKLLK